MREGNAVAARLSDVAREQGGAVQVQPASVRLATRQIQRRQQTRGSRRLRMGTSTARLYRSLLTHSRSDERLRFALSFKHFHIMWHMQNYDPRRELNLCLLRGVVFKKSEILSGGAQEAFFKYESISPRSLGRGGLICSALYGRRGPLPSCASIILRIKCCKCLFLDVAILYNIYISTVSGLQIVRNFDEVAFIQNLVFYVENAYRIPVSFLKYVFLKCSRIFI